MARHLAAEEQPLPLVSQVEGTSKIREQGGCTTAVGTPPAGVHFGMRRHLEETTESLVNLVGIGQVGGLRVVERHGESSLAGVLVRTG